MRAALGGPTYTPAIMPRRVLSALPVLLLLASASALADTYPRQPGIDAIHYVFRLTVGDASNEIAGESTATLKVAAPGVREVFFDLASAADGKGMAPVAAGGPIGHRVAIRRCGCATRRGGNRTENGRRQP